MENTHDTAIIRIRNRLVIKVGSPEFDLRGNISRFHGVERAEVVLVRGEDIIEGSEIGLSYFASLVGHWHVKLGVSLINCLVRFGEERHLLCDMLRLL